MDEVKIRFPNRKEMVLRLSKLPIHEHAVDNLYPLLLKHSDCELSIKEILDIFESAVSEYSRSIPHMEDTLRDMIPSFVMLITNMETSDKVKRLMNTH